MGKVIAVCNQKGGTAKTTTAINISTYLALLGKKVLVIDLDPQANCTSGLGVDRHGIKKSTYHVLLEEAGVQEILQKTMVENLFLAPSSLDLTGAEVELVGAMGREYRLKRGLVEERNNFDFVIIDSPPSLGLLTINALSAADSVLIPVQCEYYALEGLAQLMNTITLVKNNLNQNLVVEGIVLTMADFRTNLSREVIREVKNSFKEKVYESIIPRSIRLSEAPSYGKPIALYDKNNLGAVKYEELAKEIAGIKIISNIEETPQDINTTPSI
ncbi:MAG: ParA family protein [Candidatus Omnitrophica bacterium]|jgi:chromosome partitioning protein|nr:AAA family ATPase [Candidatus Omnitrophota bacterium]MDD5080028.1 ParA family protein [Candidatus Omnitrophota bacterium]